VVRHAPAVAKGVCYGRHDVDVEPNAETAARLVRRQLPPGLERLYCSPSHRAQTLAASLAALTGLPLKLDARLQELDFGIWEGRTWDAVHETEPDALRAWAEAPLSRAPTQGETGLSLLTRIHDFALELGSEPALLVCHAGPIRALRALAALPRHRRQPDAVQALDFARPVTPLKLETLPWA
jgi:alpha-ribazole phosphatase